MKRKNLLIAFTVLLAVAMLSSLALAQRHGRGMMRGQNYAGSQYSGGNYGPYAGLSQEQVEAMQEINDKYRGDIVELQNEMIKKRVDLRAILANQQVDTSKAVSVYKDIQDLQTKMFEKRLEMNNDLQEQGLAPYGMGPGYGPGMGRGMMSGYGQGMGPGMMHGYGQGMGPGMMHGYGMRGGQGYGPGMMHGGW
jgi:Spy/CpxP family protein refolding chaperone